MQLSPFYAYHYAHLGIPLPERSKYPLPRYMRLALRSRESGLFDERRVIPAEPCTDGDLQLAHTPAYIAQMMHGRLSRKEQKLLGFPWSAQADWRARHIVGATLAATRAALRDGIAFVLGGGTHHAHPDFGSGFCIYNDIVVAARRLQAEGVLKRTAVVDCDVHQGDGTAACAAGDASIFTLSIHAAHNFPFQKAQSDLDIPLPDGTQDGTYLKAVRRGVQFVLRQPALDCIYYIAGADVFSEDRLGRLDISAAGIAQRDRHVLTRCLRAGIPVVVLMGGGYARPIEKTVALNMQTVRMGVELAQRQLVP